MNTLTPLTRLLLAMAATFMLSSTQAGQLMSTQPTSGYLGMSVDKVPESVRAHLPDDLNETQGLIVTQLSDDSPAADDGIKLYDVLITYDGQPIDAPEKFIEKIRKDQPGRKVAFEVVRQGVVVSVSVTMGEQKTIQNAPAQQTPSKQPSNSVLKPAMNSGQIYSSHPNQHPYPYPYYSNNSNANNTYGGAGYPYNTIHPRSPRPVPYPAPRYNAPYQPVQVQPSTPVLNIAGKPSFPMQKKLVKEKHAWGDERNIWPDFYTGSTGNMWDSMMNAPFDMGRMPGGWRAPSLSTPDPVTIGDAVTNQIPPIVEEMGNMADFTD